MEHAFRKCQPANERCLIEDSIFNLLRNTCLDSSIPDFNFCIHTNKR